MLSIIFFIIIILDHSHGRILPNSDKSPFVILRHLRLSTDDQQYYIRCPYNFNYLTFHLLNYSNENCFNLYSTSNHNNHCQYHNSPCKFHSKPVQLHCNQHSYSKHVDITYQCSYNYVRKERNSSSSNPEESIALFLIAFGIIITLWILTCCIWVIRCHYDSEKHDYIYEESYPKQDLIRYNVLSNKLINDNLCLHVNPFEK